MPIQTRSSAKKLARREREKSTTPNGDVTQSCDVESPTCALSPYHSRIPASPLKFPFFDETKGMPTQDYEKFSSPSIPKSTFNDQFTRVMPAAEWESELSPISRGRNSDASQESLHAPALDVEDATLHVHTEKPRTSQATEVWSDHSDAELCNQVTEPSSPHQQEESMCDLTSVRKEVGKSSHEFIERIQNAARRRKVAMTRSRDSLAAKELERLRSHDEKQAMDAHAVDPDGENKDEGALVPIPENKGFKARPLPPTTGSLGNGGLDGVPKVEKRPTTTPFSPLLGPRRPRKIKIKALARPKQHNASRSTPQGQLKTALQESMPALPAPRINKPAPTKIDGLVRPFKARAVPLAVRAAGNGGQYGIPKVEKRPPTVAQSPLLGPRRFTRSMGTEADAPNKDVTQQGTTGKANSSTRTGTRRLVRSLSGTSSMSTPQSAVKDSPSLLGLQLLSTPHAIAEENDENTTPNNGYVKTFELHSTRRASKRAEFDIRRKTMFEVRIQREMEEREKSIQSINRDLKLLRREL